MNDWKKIACYTLVAAGTLSCSANPERADGVRTTAEPQAEAEATVEPVHVKVLAFNDLHGNLEGPTGSVRVKGQKIEAGGADHLATRIAQLKAANPDAIVVTAGDLVGASPLLSSLFHDEPTIEAMNAIQLDYAAVGNHEFDEGLAELRRLQEGGCHPEDGCQDGDPFDGAKFPFLAANVSTSDGKTIFPPYEIREVGGEKVAFIGLTLEGTPNIVSPEGVRGLKFADEAEAINALVPSLREQGAEAIVVLIHEGGYPTVEETDINDCPDISGPIVDIVSATDDAVDLFVTGHTHRAYICEVDDRLVTSASSYGRLLTEIDLTLDPATGDVVAHTAKNIVVDVESPEDPAIVALKKKYGAIAGPLANEKIGTILSDISREMNEDGESPLGRLIADIQLQATKAPNAGNAQIAFMNPGGIRSSLELAPRNGEGPGEVTYAEAHTVQPFGNSLVTMTLTGAQIRELLEAQFSNRDKPSLLQVSKGFTYTWRATAPEGQRVDPTSMKLNGVQIDPTANYRVTVNSYLSTGGDGYETLEQGTNRLGGPVDLEAFVVYFNSASPVKAPTERRIIRTE